MTDTDNLGRTIRLFLADGRPSGVLTAEIMNWIGKAVVGGRADMPQVVKRPEASRTGIYFLIGPDPDSLEKSRVYVGEGDIIAERLKKHHSDPAKDFWTRVCFFVSKDENLTKAHARYLESRFIQIIGASGRAVLANGTDPSFDLLPEADRADMEFFITQVRLLMPVLGFDVTREPVSVVAAQVSADPENPLFVIRSVGVDACMSIVDDEYVVHEGSTARADAKSSYNAYQALRKILIGEGKLERVPGNNDLLRFRQDVPFSSPSAASSVILDRNSSGPREWRVDGEKTTFAEWQQAQIDAISG
ncbi:MAG: GIY-YIG nuclease family protein [Rhodospirillales bacterium]|nr:GIY-YIG nuclease family protein [Rhodospirillales bacterium]